MDPALASPLCERLRRIHSEKIQLRIVPVMRELRSPEPRLRKLIAAIGHVPAAEDSHLKKLARRQLRLKIRVKISSCRLGSVIDVTLLHQIVDDDLCLHPFRSRYPVS